GCGDLWVAVAQVVGATVEVHVDEPLALDVVDEVALAPVDDQRHPGVHPELGLVRVPVLPGPGEHLVLGREGDQLLGPCHLRHLHGSGWPAPQLWSDQIRTLLTNFCQGSRLKAYFMNQNSCHVSYLLIPSAL